MTAAAAALLRHCRPLPLPLGRAGAVRAPDTAGRDHPVGGPEVHARPGPRAPHSAPDNEAAATAERTTRQP